jgi:phage terminase large subunit-like protein
MSKSLTLTIPARHPAQRQVVDEAGRFNVLACGRRWGKSWLGVDLLIEDALHGQPVAWFSPTYRMLSDAWRMVREVVQPVIRAARADEHRIELLGGGTVDMFSLDNPDTARGRKFKTVIVDEAAMSPNLEAAWLNVIRPTLADLRGGAWFMSTPRGHNFFWSLFTQGRDQVDGWRAWKMPTVANPYIPPDEIEAARKSLPERVFAQEFLAEFIDDAGAVFRNVYRCAIGTPVERMEDGKRCIVGVDWAKAEDFTVLSVLDMGTRSQVYMDRFNQIDYRFQLGRLKALLSRFPGAWVIAEANSIGDPLIEQLRDDGIRVQPFLTTPASKTRAIEDLALAFETESITVLPDPVQTDELLAFTSTRLPSGAFRYAAPPGGHDDTVMALAMAWSGASSALPAPIPSPGDPFDKQKPAEGVKMVRTETGVKFLRPERKRSHGVDPFAKVSR